MAKVRIPTSAVQSGAANYTAWVKLLNDIQAVDFLTDINNLKSAINDSNNASNLELGVKESDKLAVKEAAEVEIDVKADKSNLVKLNKLVKTIVAKFAKDSKGIVEVNKLLTNQLKSTAGDDAKAKVLRSILVKLKTLSKIHNDLLTIPLMTLKALTTLTSVK